MTKIKYILFIILFISGSALVFLLAQEKELLISDVEHAILLKDYAEARNILNELTTKAIATDDQNALKANIRYVGKLDKLTQNEVPTIDSYIFTVGVHFKSHLFYKELYYAAAAFYEDESDFSHCYAAYKQASAHIDSIPKVDPELQANVAYNLGTIAYKLGNVVLSKEHHLKAFALRKQSKNMLLEGQYFSANALGIIMWNASKYDSAIYYYNEALATLNKMPENALNRFYHPALVLNNLSGLYSADGMFTQAIDALKKSISYSQKFLASKEDYPQKRKARQGLYEAIDNVAGIYSDIGDYKKAGDLLLYSYQQKLKQYDSTFPGIFISEIILGQHYNAVKDYNQALVFLQKGIAKSSKAEGDYLFWQADAFHALALAYEGKKKINKAEVAYLKAKELYETAYGSDFDNLYLEFLQHLSNFYASNGNYQQGILLANKAFRYISKTQSADAFATISHYCNLASLYLQANKYLSVLKNAQSALQVLENNLKRATTIKDSVRIEMNKPLAIYYYERARYELSDKKDTALLQSIYNNLLQAIQVLDKRKDLFYDTDNLKVIFANNKMIFDFAQMVTINLFELTGDSKYLDQLNNIQESSTYYKLHNRFAGRYLFVEGVPQAIVEKEEQIKNKFAELIDNPDNKYKISNYLKIDEELAQFKNELRQKYPKYYNLRYGSVLQPLLNYQSLIPKGSSLVRYYFVAEQLYAMVLTNTEKHLFKLDTTNLYENIESVYNPKSKELPMEVSLYELYNQLWKPLALHLKTEEVIIIPDGIVSTVSFDMLLFRPIKSTKEFANSALIAKHSFIYQYSIAALQPYEIGKKMSENYIAFSPGFNDAMKKEYSRKIADSVLIDREYMLLLPQPNSLQLIEKMKRKFNGTAFLGEESSLQSFKKNATDKKIIHLATHGEFNNIRPEQSKLIFAKNENEHVIDSNALYLKDIYGLELNTQLAILAACETGRPGYEDGEGMVSFAHALNYAGSENILTSLWKTDEQSSCKIIQLFLNNIEQKLPLTKALQQAKLQYLQDAEGRTIAPPYWAGLILMGNNTMIELGYQSDTFYWWIIGFLFIVTTYIFLSFLKQKRR